MALILKDRVQETTTTTGTGTLTLGGAVTGYQSFSAIGNANTTYYAIYANGGSEWEVGIGTYTASGTTLSRDTVLSSSNSGSLVSFSAGTKNVWCDYPAAKAVYYDLNGNITTNSLFEGFSNVAAAGTTTVLTVSSVPNYVVTGSGGQTYQLPDATTLPNGVNFTFNNNQSSGTIVVKNNSSTTIATIQSGGLVDVSLLSNSIAAGTWDVHNLAPSNVAWSTNTLDYPGSITSATWNGTAVAINRGGTGQTTASAAFNALSPITTTGDLIIGNGTNSATRLGIGTNGYVLTSNGTTAAWQASTGGVTSFSAGTTGLTPSTATTGAVTLAGTLAIANGGTNATATPTAGAVPYGTGTAYAFTVAGTSGQVLTSNGSGTPTWSTPAGGVTLSNDTTTASNLYPTFAAATSGSVSTIYTGNAKLLYKPSTGELQAPETIATNGLVINSTTVGTSYTVAAGQNAMSVGPMTVASGVAVTITSGQRWVVL